jgi:hypothetical protein
MAIPGCDVEMRFCRMLQSGIQGLLVLFLIITCESTLSFRRKKENPVRVERMVLFTDSLVWAQDLGGLWEGIPGSWKGGRGQNHY